MKKTKRDILEEFNKELGKLMNKYDAEFTIEGAYGDPEGIGIELPEGWITYGNSGSKLCLHDLQNPEFTVDGEDE